MPVKLHFSVVPLELVPVAEPMGSSEKYRPVVLVVDDEPAIADTFAEILTRSGYTAVPAYDAEKALDTALLTPPQLLISDVVLPGMSGIELAIWIKRIFPECGVLLFSGQAATSGMLTSEQGAGHQFTLLSKPVHPTDLLRRVSESLDSQREHSVTGVS
jgi:DNA-binding response OmpR family regulator